MPIPTELLATITDHLSPGGKPGNANDAARLWQRLFAKFRPLLGPLSTETLFLRTLFEHSVDFPWLQEAAASLPGEGFALFLRRLEDQAPQQVVAVNRILVTSYTRELADLIGDRLASHFLQAAFAHGDINKNT